MFEGEIILDNGIPKEDATYCKVDDEGRLMIIQFGRCIRLSVKESGSLLSLLKKNDAKYLNLIGNTK